MVEVDAIVVCVVGGRVEERRQLRRCLLQERPRRLRLGGVGPVQMQGGSVWEVEKIVIIRTTAKKTADWGTNVYQRWQLVQQPHPPDPHPPPRSSVRQMSFV
jgi:hypothetical protein